MYNATEQLRKKEIVETEDEGSIMVLHLSSSS